MGTKRNFNHLYYLILITITLAGAVLRFTSLNWGGGFFFHPDENNMAGAVVRFSCAFKPIAIANFQLPIFNCSLNPHFFAYGQFPLYLAYFSNYLIKTTLTALLKLKVPMRFFLQPNLSPDLNFKPRIASFGEAIFWLRFWSALAATLTIPLVYLITKLSFPKFSLKQPRGDETEKIFPQFIPKMFSLGHPRGVQTENFLALLAATFVAFTPGLIQAAHFGTTESLLTFFFLVIIYLSLKILHKTSTNRRLLFTIALAGAVSGIALGTKLTAVYFLAAPIFALILSKLQAANSKLQANCKQQTANCKRFDNWKIGNWKLFEIWNLIFGILLFLALALIFFILSSPYNLLAWQKFQQSSAYEIQIAAGAIRVFYTRQFLATLPFLFQLQKIFPYALGWPLFILGTGGFFLTMYMLVVKIKKIYQFPVACYFVLISAFLFYLIPNAALFTKWTRFMTPVLPLVSIFAAHLLSFLFTASKKSALKSPSSKPASPAPVIIGALLMVTSSIIPGLLFFTIYTRPDVRIAASDWIYNNIPEGAFILSESGNVINLPVALPGWRTAKRYNVINFDFYHLDEDPRLFNQLLTYLVQAEYILVPSRRIFANYTRFPHKYPLTTAYYNALFSGKLGFTPIHRQTSFPSLQFGNYRLQLADEFAEETWSVFDHPVVRLYKKTNQYAKEDYQQLLNPTNPSAIRLHSSKTQNSYK